MLHRPNLHFFKYCQKSIPLEGGCLFLDHLHPYNGCFSEALSSKNSLDIEIAISSSSSGWILEPDWSVIGSGVQSFSLTAALELKPQVYINGLGLMLGTTFFSTGTWLANEVHLQRFENLYLIKNLVVDWFLVRGFCKEILNILGKESPVFVLWYMGKSTGRTSGWLDEWRFR